MTPYLTLTIIDAAVSDSEGMDKYVDQGIQQTLRPIFEWRDSTGTNVTFLKHFDADELTFGLRLRVTAEFEDVQDLAYFKMMYTDYPKNKLHMLPRMDAVFIRE